MINILVLLSSYFIAMQDQSPVTLSNSLCNLLNISPCKSAKNVVRKIAETVTEPLRYTYPNASQDATTHFSCIV